MFFTLLGMPWLCSPRNAVILEAGALYEMGLLSNRQKQLAGRKAMARAGEHMFSCFSRM
jgi:hypothetical protein